MKEKLSTSFKNFFEAILAEYKRYVHMNVLVHGRVKCAYTTA